MGTLFVAAGGGGDAITASALAGMVPLAGPPIVMTYSWDRLMVDPVPGPRTAGDFTGLRHLAVGVLEVLPSTRVTAPAGSSLPRLSADLPARLLLLDPTGGAAGMAAQIQAAADFFGTDQVALVDAGGDVLTDGHDPGLRSPLADQLALAACVRTDLPARLLIAAPGIDGELPPETVLARLHTLAANQVTHLTGDHVAPVRGVFDWHPSEASGLLAAAADGHRGLVEIRDAGDLVEVTTTTTAVFTVDANAAMKITPAARLTASQSLTQAETIIHEATGISEIRYETEKAVRLRGRPAHRPTPADLQLVDQHAREARNRGADYISMRRLAELLNTTTPATFAGLSQLLAIERPDRYERSIYRAGSAART